MKGDKELRQYHGGTVEGSPARGHSRPVTARAKVGLICLRLGGQWERMQIKRAWRRETFRKQFPPCHWKGEWEVNACFLYSYSDILSIRSTVVTITSKFLMELLAVLHWRPTGYPPTHQQVRTRHSWRSGLLLLVETRTWLNVASYKFLQQRASLQHVARNVAVAMVNIHV